MISRDGCHNNQECRCKIVKQGRGSPVFSEEPHSLGDFVVGASTTAHHNVPGGYGGIEERLCLSQIPSNLRTWGLRILHNLRLSTFAVLPVLVGALSSLFRTQSSFVPGQGCGRTATGATAGDGASPGSSAGRRPPPSLRTPGRLKTTAVDAVTSPVAVCLGIRFTTADIAKTACEPRTTASRLPDTNTDSGIRWQPPISCGR